MITPDKLREVAYDLEQKKIDVGEAEKVLWDLMAPPATVINHHPLSDEERQKLVKQIEKMWQGSVITPQQYLDSWHFEHPPADKNATPISREPAKMDWESEIVF